MGQFVTPQKIEIKPIAAQKLGASPIIRPNK